jgi:hypothetical protein
MNIISELAPSSLAQRIAKVRNCMLVELSTGVPATDKELFVSLCQIYDQNRVEIPYTAIASPPNVLDQALSFSHLIPESLLLHGLAATLQGDTPSRQHRIGFSVISWPNSADFDDWSDWWDR